MYPASCQRLLVTSDSFWAPFVPDTPASSAAAYLQLHMVSQRVYGHVRDTPKLSLSIGFGKYDSSREGFPGNIGTNNELALVDWEGISAEDGTRLSEANKSGCV